jgi:hypothetical protein
MDEFPGNAHAQQRITENKAPEPAKSEEASEPKKVINGKVTTRNKPLGTRLKNMFLNEGAGFGEHLVENVVVPMIKDMALSIVTQIGDGLRQGVEGALFGADRVRPRPRSTGYGPTRVNYNNISRSSTRRPEDRPPYRREAVRRSNRVEDVIVESREAGDMVIEELNAKIDDFGHCTVADFYSCVNIVPQSTDNDWGWSDIREARVHRLSPDEFVITMPRPRFLER